MSSNSCETLIDRICVLYTKDSSISANDLFKRACEDDKLEISSFYKEDIINIGLYACQIILNSHIFITSVSGNTKKQAYENTIRKFINLCFSKRNLQFKYPEYIPNSFYLELQESISSIDLGNSLQNKLVDILEECRKIGQLSKINTKNYEYAKKKLAESHSDISLSEKYRIINNNNSLVCSIFVNDIFLLQQGQGEDRKEALENTVTELFKIFGIVVSENSNCEAMANGDLGQREILQQLSEKFKEKKATVAGSVNYWDIIQDCVKTLQFKMIVDAGVVKINNVTIVDIPESNEYVGNIKAGKKLVEILSQERRITKPAAYQPKPPPVMNFQKTSKIYSEEEREDKMKKIAIATEKEYLKNQTQMYWNVLNREFLRENCKVNPSYGNVNGVHTCALVFQLQDIISGEGINKIDAREKAAINLVKKYLPKPESK